MTSIDPDAIAAGFATLAAHAGALILDIRARGPATRVKADASPVTEADEAAEALILEGLEDLLPGVPVLAEEEAAAGRVPVLGTRFLVVDPLDGTKDFIAGGADYTVNIALVDHGVPVAGAVHQPETATTWWGGTRAFRRIGAAPATPIRVRAPTAAGLVAVVSRSNHVAETDRWLDRLGVTTRLPAGSSLKFCRVAEGAADIYARHGPVMEWDTAAGHAHLLAAGGTLEAPGGDFGYGRLAARFTQGPFAAWGAFRPPPSFDDLSGQARTV